MSVLDLSSVVLSLQSHTLTVKRAVAGTYAAGRYSAGAPATLSVSANVQPASAEDLALLPEGERTTDTIVVYTIAELQPTSQANGELGDLVNYQGRDYRVRHVEAWAPNGAYWRSVASRVGQ